MKCSEVEAKLVWIQTEEGVRRLIRARFKNLQCQGTSKHWLSLDGGFWGFLHMMESKDGWTYNRLAVIERFLEGPEQALEEASSIKKIRDVDFTEVLNDVFGDG